MTGKAPTHSFQANGRVPLWTRPFVFCGFAVPASQWCPDRPLGAAESPAGGHSSGDGCLICLPICDFPNGIDGPEIYSWLGFFGLQHGFVNHGSGHCARKPHVGGTGCLWSGQYDQHGHRPINWPGLGRIRPPEALPRHRRPDGGQPDPGLLDRRFSQKSLS